MTPAMVATIRAEYLDKFALVFGGDPDAAQHAHLDLIVRTLADHGEASLRLALETWMLHGPRVDHTRDQ